MSIAVPGFPPAPVVSVLRLEGLAVLAAGVAAYWFVGGNWWVFAVLLLAPDLAMLGALAGPRIGALAYNAAHTYSVPLLLGAAGWFSGTALAIDLALIWAVHIGMDRALGYGLKYPDGFHSTHLGPIGPGRRTLDVADPR